MASADADANPVALALAGLFSLAAALGIGRFIYTPILPLMADGLGLTPGETGIIASANFAGYLAGAIWAAQGGNAPTTRMRLIAWLLLSAATTFAMGFTESGFAGLWLSVALRFAGGFSSALVMVGATAIVLVRLDGLRASRLSSVHFAGVGLGIVVSSFAVAAAAVLPIAGLATWRLDWIAGGAIAALLALGADAFLHGAGREPAPVATMPAEPTADGERAERKLHHKAAWLALAYGLFGFGYVITATFLIAIVREQPALSAIEPLVWVVVGFSAMVSVPLWVGLSRWTGLIVAYSLAALTEAAGVAASVLVDGQAGVILAAALLGGTFMGLTALGFMAARAQGGTAAAVAMARLTSAFSAGQIIGPLIAGFGRDITQSYAAPSLMAAVALVVAALAALKAR